MTDHTATPDPLDYVKKLWGNMGFSLPGMVTPTLDVGELDKRIADMKAVEGWLKMNLGMLQMTIQGLEMQRATLAAMQAFSQSASSGDNAAGANPFAGAAMWPWNYMSPGCEGAAEPAGGKTAEAPQAEAAAPARPAAKKAG